MAFVAYMSLKSSYPSVVQGLFNHLGTVFLHFLAYGGLVVIYFWAFLRERARGYLWAALFSVSYGVVLEVAQLWVPGRTFSVGDMAVNVLGAAVGVMGVMLVKGEGLGDKVGR